MTIARRVVLALVFLAAVVLWFLLLRPDFLGGPASYIMVSGTSMEPAMHHGDLALMRKQGSYGKGDIVAFRAEGGIVIHRILGGTAEEGFLVQGDNKEAPDPWRPRPENILGEMWFRVPRAGLFLALLRQPLHLAALAGVLGALSVLTAGTARSAARTATPQSAPAAANGGGGRRLPGAKDRRRPG